MSGITPAGAGKTQFCLRCKLPARDHPRRCGENPPSAKSLTAKHGSPPQVRGKRRVCRAGCHKHGITPAGAGKTQSVKLWNFARRDHPRRCGENTIVGICKEIFMGSPPQVRGKLTVNGAKNHRPRITPAGAGKTIHHKTVLRQCRDHPRRCGENYFLSVYVIGLSGSPPQVRGKLYRPYNKVASIRITPAGAGKTSAPMPSGSPGQDHPRRCGENVCGNPCCCGIPGSPPQVRGKHCAFVRTPIDVGITPAGAGKTTFIKLIIVRHKDHPRRCGENLRYVFAAA